MSWVLIRHGKTRGNLEGRYIGSRTDEPLCPEGIEELKLYCYPKVQKVFVSPMRRCLETASLLCPDLSPETVPDFRECDFGLFENKNYAELNGRKDYQAWIDSGGNLPFPQGESRRQFTDRTLAAFRSIIHHGKDKDVALIAHGGTIMAIMEAFAFPRRDYYDYQVKNGCGYILRPDGSSVRIGP